MTTGHQPERPWENEPPGPEQAAAERRGNAGCLGMVGLILVLAVSCGVAVAGGDEDEPSLDAVRYDVERVCEDFRREAAQGAGHRRVRVLGYRRGA